MITLRGNACSFRRFLAAPWLVAVLLLFSYSSSSSNLLVQGFVAPSSTTTIRSATVVPGTSHVGRFTTTPKLWRRRPISSVRPYAVAQDEETEQTKGNRNRQDTVANTGDNRNNKDDDTDAFDLDQEERELALSLAKAELDLEQHLVPTAIVLLAAVAGTWAFSASAGSGSWTTLQDVLDQVQAFATDPGGTIQSTLDGVGPAGILYFGLAYVLAELLALPATPLTLSAGYLFGLAQGVAVVLAAGTVSAMIGFGVGKTLLRGWVERVLDENPKFRKLDRAIGAQGFQLLVLVRLSPIFPFSLINYTYGASSISFPTFVAGTLLGFTPSTVGYVYAGLVGKEVLLGQGDQPWYVYAAGAALLLGLLKLVTDVATQVVEAIEDE